jgi:hypothetical protein
VQRHTASSSWLGSGERRWLARLGRVKWPELAEGEGERGSMTPIMAGNANDFGETRLVSPIELACAFLAPSASPLASRRIGFGLGGAR